MEPSAYVLVVALHHRKMNRKHKNITLLPGIREKAKIMEIVMENYIKMATKLYVAVNEKGEIVNSNDFKWLGPAFALEDTKVIIENGEVVENYALHIDEDFNKQGAFSILNCSKITASKIARLYCEKHDITPIKHSRLYYNNYENIYQVIDVNNVEYHFHIARAYYEDGALREHFGAYISIRNKDKYQFVDITNINDL